MFLIWLKSKPWETCFFGQEVLASVLKEMEAPSWELGRLTADEAHGSDILFSRWEWQSLRKQIWFSAAAPLRKWKEKHLLWLCRVLEWLLLHLQTMCQTYPGVSSSVLVPFVSRGRRTGMHQVCDPPASSWNILSKWRAGTHHKACHHLGQTLEYHRLLLLLLQLKKQIIWSDLMPV